MGFGSDFVTKYKIAVDAAKAKTEIKDFDNLLRKAGSGVGEAFASIGSPVTALGTGVLAVSAAAVTAGVSLFALTKAASEYGSEIFDATKKTGLHAETISAMKLAAEESSSSLEQVTAGIAKYAKTVGAASKDSQEAAKFMKAFGVEPKDALDDLDGSLAKVFKKIQEAPPGIQRMTLAQKAFGKSGADLLPFIDSFDGDLTGLIDKAKKLGVTIDDGAAAASDRFGDSLDTLGAQVSSLARAVGYKLMPPLTDAIETISDFVADKADDFGRVLDNTETLVKGIAGYWKDASQYLEKYVTKFETLSGQKINPTDFGTGGFGGPDTNPYIPKIAKAIGERGGKGEAAGFAGKDAAVNVRPQQEEFEDLKKAREKAFEEELKNRSQQNQILLRGERQQYSAEQKALETALESKTVSQQEYTQKALKLNEEYFQKTAGLLYKSMKDGSIGKTGTKLQNEKLEYANAYNALKTQVEQEDADIKKRAAASDKKAIDDAIGNAEKAMDRSLDVYRAGYEKREALLDASLAAETTTEAEHIRDVGRIRLEALTDERAQLQELLKLKQIGSDKRSEIENRLKVLDTQISTQQIRNVTDWSIAVKKATADAKAAIDDANESVRRAEYDKESSRRETRAASTPAGTAMDQANQRARVAREQMLADLDFARESLRIERDAALEKARGLKNELKVKAAISEAYRLKELGLEEEYQRKMLELAGIYAKEREQAAAEDNYFKQFSENWNNLLDEMASSVGVVNIIDTIGAAGVDMMASMAQAAGSAVEAWALYGESVGTALKKALAAELAHIAGIAVVKAIYATALGFLLLAEQDYPAAASAFISAGIWASIAGGTALAAKAIAGDSFKGGGKSSGSSSGGGGRDVSDPKFGSAVNNDPTPLTREPQNVYASGREAAQHRIADAVDRLEQKIGSMRPGDVVTAGLPSNQNLVADTYHRAVVSGGKRKPALDALGVK